jgi:hypothetical protein
VSNLTVGDTYERTGEAQMTEDAPAGETPPGWYPNPTGAPGIRYFDGRDWTAFHRAEPSPAPVAPQAAPAHPGLPYPMPALPYPMPPHTAVVVTGPNHALHAVLTLLTFWACGGWAWIWLIVAVANRRQVRVVAVPPPR